ncbi:type II secretion system protein G [Anaerohalosphaera lusitana]|uniref:Type II secretion system protein G n=1 Tax=Anaerohalosphaera lusitana TaxID=1936003 RepID=A0A1U9NQ21_9BACT|nr:prepilin-type N-terminal cleavage/methylation domain-containing protein [Anaerohalosphaera lusitana]AQT70031.1 type II secretion system protein G [Anaerohalosphaera lusitana]
MKKSGFTLIELLVVISIIALLLAIMMPALGIAKERARRIYCSANLKNLSMAWFTYQSENGGKLVGASTVNGADGDWVSLPEDNDGNKIYRDDWDYTDVSVEYKQNGIEQGTLWEYSKNLGSFHCPSDKRDKDPSQQAWRSYQIQTNMNGQSYGPLADTEDIVSRFTQIRNPSSKYVFVETTDWRGMNLGSWRILPNTDERMWRDPLSVRHGSYGCFGFADGHAESHKWVEESTFEMSETQKHSTRLHEDEEGVDLEWARKHAGGTR